LRDTPGIDFAGPGLGFTPPHQSKRGMSPQAWSSDGGKSSRVFRRGKNALVNRTVLGQKC
jgi:hypothetical protein